MESATVNGTTLEYEVRGDGEPVALLYCGFIADGFAPLLEQPALARRYRLISYHRRGYAGSARPVGPVSMAEQASDCIALLRHLAVPRAHLVGHSLGASIALQVSLDAPDLVHSLALFEPLLPGVPDEPAARQYMLDAVAGAYDRYAAGDKVGAVDRFLQGAFLPGYREVLDRALPTALDQAAADADTVFGVELPAIQDWRFTHEDAARIRQPVLSVVHQDRLWPGFQATHDLLLAWLPQAEAAVIPDTTHLLQIMNPRAAATALAGFLAGHPLPIHA